MTSILLGGFGWASGDLYGPHADGRIDFMAENLIAGSTYPAYEVRQALEQTTSADDTTDCRSGRSRNVAIVSLALFDIIRSEKLAYGRQLGQSAKEKIVRSLKCNPSDPVLWLGLFETETSDDGQVSPLGIASLRESYLLGPNEGWVMSRRARLASAFLLELPPDLSGKVTRDVVSLVAQGFWEAPTAIIVGSSPKIRGQLIAALDNVRPTQLRLFARQLRDSGVPAAELPWADTYDTQRELRH